MKNKKIGVIMGGISHEREVSLKTGKQIYEALKKKGYNVEKIILDSDDYEVIYKSNIDFAFIALHGKYGEDGTLQGFLEMLNIPYTGSKVLGSAICMNKNITKSILKSHNINFPKGIKISKSDYNKETIKKYLQMLNINFPVVLKPNSEGSAIGLYFVETEYELFEKIENDFSLTDELLIEEKIEGIEITVGVLENRALDIIEICPKSGINDFNAKYIDGESEFIIPARIDEKIYKESQNIALKMFETLCCSVYARADMIIKDNECYVLEMNTLPGMTNTSLLPMAAKFAKIEFEDLVEKILLYSMKEYFHI